MESNEVCSRGDIFVIADSGHNGLGAVGNPFIDSLKWNIYGLDGAGSVIVSGGI